MLEANNDDSVHIMPETNFKEKIRCGEIYRSLNGNEMFQKFYYRCLECSMDFESSTEFEEHVIEHILNEEDDECEMGGNGTGPKDVIDLSSEDEDDEAYALLHESVEVTSLVEDDDLAAMPAPIMQMVSPSAEVLTDSEHEDDEDGEDEQMASVKTKFPCDGLRRQAQHRASDPDISCNECPAYFRCVSDLESHFLIHQLRITIPCPHCYEVFADDDTLSIHIRGKRKKHLNHTEDNDISANKRPRNDSTVTETENVIAQQNDRHDNDVAIKEIAYDGKISNDHAILTKATTTITENNENNRADNANNIQMDMAKVT